MSFTASCPFCGASYPGIPEASAGHRAKCGRCNQQFLALPPEPALAEAAQRATRMKLRCLRVAAILIDPALVEKIPKEVLLRLEAIPIARRGDELVVAMARPEDLPAVDELRRHYSQIKLVMGLANEIREALETRAAPKVEAATAVPGTKYDALADGAIEDLRAEFEKTQTSERAAEAAGDDELDETPAGRAVAEVLAGAAVAGASEVRIMDQEGKLVAQGRTGDGLAAIPAATDVEYRRFIARLKDRAGCDPSKRGIEQSGSIDFSHGGRQYEFLVRILPGGKGEDRAVMRVLDQAMMRQRRAQERREKVEEALAKLTGSPWKPPGFDPANSREFIIQTIESELAVVRLVYGILFGACERDLTSLVVEPLDNGGARVLGRAEGAEHFEPVREIPDFARQPFTARLQIMSGIDLTYTQEGKIGACQLFHHSHQFSVRTATIPTSEGPMIALRLGAT